MSRHTVEVSEKQSPMERIAAFIVDKRKAFYLLYIGAAIFCVFSSGWVAVNDDLTSYLSDTTETRQGLTVMEAEFVTFGTSRIMVDNISYRQAESLAEQIEMMEGVKSVEFNGSRDHYTNGSALFSITYDGTATDPVSLEGLDGVKALLDGYDVYITGDTGDSASESLNAEMQVVMVIAVVIILVVLLFTSHTYMEIPVLLMTFGMAALMNKGTNFIFGEISFVSNSVAVVLQLALAIDYAIILCHRYTEERERLEAREAVVAALYLDGGVEVAASFVERTLIPKMSLSLAREPENPKSALQEKLQEGGITPTYKLVETQGPPHDRTFVAQVYAGDKGLARGVGRTKKEAESQAAKTTLARLSEFFGIGLSDEQQAEKAAEKAARAEEKAAKVAARAAEKAARAEERARKKSERDAAKRK